MGVIILLRSPKGAALSQMYQYPNIHDLSALSQHDYNLVVLLMSIAGGSAKSKHAYGMNGMMQGLFPNGKEAVDTLQKSGLVIKASTLDEALHRFSNPELKDILRSKGLKVSGKKEELVNRICAVLTDDERKELMESSLFWLPTPLGFEYIYSLYKEREQMEMSAINAFLSRDFEQGTDIIRRYKVRFPVSGGINEGDFSHIAQDTKIMDRFYQNKMDTISAIACFQYSFGGKLMYPPSIDENGFDIQKTQELEIRYITSTMCTLRDLVSYKEANINSYEILCCDDACKICKKASKRIHEVAEVKIGTNAPPFHLGCRCTTVAHFPE